MAGDDFVNVRLTAFGKERAAGTRMQVHAGNHSFYFAPDEVQRVTRAFDWEKVLKTEHFNGHPLFEIVPEAVVPDEETASTTKVTESMEVIA